MHPKNTTTTDSQKGRDGAEGVKEIGALEALWSLFGSMKTAIVLLLLLAAASVAGTIIEQNAPSEEYIKAYGQAKYAFIRGIGLTDLYHSGWYVMLLSLFSLNLAVCSIKRFGISWRRTFEPKVYSDPEQVAGLQRSEQMDAAGSPDQVASRAETALRNLSYRVAARKSDGTTSIYAAKGRLSIWGPYFTHVAILVILAGSMAGNLLGSHGRVIIAEGESADSYYLDSDPSQPSEPKLEKLGFDVNLVKFRIRHDKEHNPTGYMSSLEIYDGGKRVADKVIDVNYPLTYKGISFYQSSYGLARLILKITSPSGESREISYKVGTLRGPEGLVYGVPKTDEPIRQVRFGSRKLTLYLHNIAPDYVGGQRVNASEMPLNPAADVLANDRYPEYRGLDAWTRLGWVQLSKKVDYKGYTVAVERAVDYTVLEVSRNPGLPIVYAGFILILFGVFVSFYVTHKVIRVSISPGPRDSSVVIGATSRADASNFDRDFDHLRGALS